MSAPAALAIMYKGFALAARAAGYNRAAPARITFRDKTTVTVASDVGSASQPLKKQFLVTLNEPNITRRSDDPKVLDSSGTSKDVMLGLFMVGLRMNHGNYAGTLTETREVLDALGNAVLEIIIGSELLCRISGHEALIGSPGFNNYTDTATATATSRSSINKDAQPFYLEWPRILYEGAQVAANLYIDKTSWTANDNFDVYLELGFWKSVHGDRQGNAAQVEFIG